MVLKVYKEQPVVKASKALKAYKLPKEQQVVKALKDCKVCKV